MKDGRLFSTQTKAIYFNGIIIDIYEIDKVELKEIIESYGLNDLVFDTFKQVEPDTALYIFHDKDNKKLNTV